MLIFLGDSKNGADEFTLLPSCPKFSFKELCHDRLPGHHIFFKSSPFKHSRFRRKLKAMEERLGLDEVGFHTFRHDCVTNLIHFGGEERSPLSLMQAAELSRHNDLNTLKLYCHTPMERLKPVADRVASAQLKSSHVDSSDVQRPEARTITLDGVEYYLVKKS